MNIHFDNPLQSLTKQTLTTLSLNSLVQVINKPSHRCGHIIDWVLFDRTMTSIKNRLLQTHLNQTFIALNPTSMFQSLSLLPYTGLLGTLPTLTALHLLLNFPVFQFSSVENANQFCYFLRTVIDKHVSPYLRKVITHNSSPWFESIRDDLL